MSDIALLAAAATVRSWTHLYTRGLPEEQAARRRAEIESDLWECRADPTASQARKAVGLLGRLAAGASDDLWWRIEEVDVADTIALRRVIAAVSFAALAASAALSLALLSSARTDERAGLPMTCEASAVPVRVGAAFSMEIVRCAGTFVVGPKPAR